MPKLVIARATRLPNGYLWAMAYALEALCGLAIAERMPEATIWVDELQGIAARSGMREFTARALWHKPQWLVGPPIIAANERGHCALASFQIQPTSIQNKACSCSQPLRSGSV